MRLKSISSFKLLACLASVAGIAHADYSGGKISGQDQTYTGNIAIEYSEDAGNRITGGVELAGSANDGKTTVLEGNIAIKAGEDYLSDPENPHRNSGVWVGYSDEIVSDADPVGYDNISGSSVTLKTAGTNDRIVMDIYGKYGRGVAIESYRLDAALSQVTLDASSSSEKIVINGYGNGVSGISSQGRTAVNVIGDIEFNLYTANSSAIYASGASDRGVESTGTNQVTVTGTSTMNIAGDGSRGVSATNAGKVSFGKHVTVNIAGNSASTRGILANNGSEVRVNEGVTILADASSTGATGIYVLNNSTVDISGDVNISVSGNNSNGIQANEGASITFSDKVTVTSGRHGIIAYTGSTIILEKEIDVVSMGDTTGAATSVSANEAGSRVYLSGAKRIINYNTAGVSNWSSITAYNGGLITDKDGLAHQYNIVGRIRSMNDGSVVDLKMNGNSTFTGYTALDGGGTKTLDLAFLDNSTWTVTGNSTLSNLTLGQGSALQLAFDGTSLTDIISATGSITLEAGSIIYLTGDLSGLQGNSFDFFSGTLVNNGVEFVAFDGTDWVKYEYTQTGANTFEFKADAPVVIEEPGFIPEPATATLGLLGLASLMFRRKK